MPIFSVVYSPFFFVISIIFLFWLYLVGLRPIFPPFLSKSPFIHKAGSTSSMSSTDRSVMGIFFSYANPKEFAKLIGNSLGSMVEASFTSMYDASTPLSCSCGSSIRLIAISHALPFWTSLPFVRSSSFSISFFISILLITLRMVAF